LSPEVDSQAQLHLASGLRGIDFAESRVWPAARIEDILRAERPVRNVENVKGFRAELRADTVGQLRGFQQRRIEIQREGASMVLRPALPKSSKSPGSWRGSPVNS